MNPSLAHTSGPLLHSFAAFGTDWLVVAAIPAVALAVAVALIVKGRGTNPVARFADGAARLTGLPGWAAAGAVTLLGYALPMAALGFYWDVAWHIDKGRDEFLFSPPHVALLLGLTGIGLAGLVSIGAASFARADVGWTLARGRIRLPYGAAALLFAGAISQVGYFVDELWHYFYGLDVSMWGPTHLTMVSAAAFSPFALWGLLAEAGAGRPGAELTPVGRGLKRMAADVTVIALSAWQLEFDLGVPQWQQLYQPVLIAFTAGMALTVGRVVLGRGGALIAAGAAIAVRVLAGLVVGGLGLTSPRFPLYLAAALVVEAVFLFADRRDRRAREHGAAGARWTAARTGVVAGLGVATLGLAGEAVWINRFGMHRWTTNLLPGLWIAVPVAVAAAVLGVAMGRVVTGRPSGLRRGAVAACFVALVAGAALPVFRHVPDLTATVRTTPTDRPGWVDVSVELPAGTGRSVDRLEVLSWQGGGSQRARLIERPGQPGTFDADRPVPVAGTWKSMVHYVSKDQLGSIPVYMPEDEDIGASEIPVVAERTQPFSSLARALQRESRAGGPAWPATVAYTWVLLSIGGLVALIVAGFVGVDRRRRAGAFPSAPGAGSLDGRRVVVTGAAGGIGSALVAALAANGARVAGIDRTPADGVVVADLTDPDSTARAMAEAASRLGGIDVLVNNAGVGTAGPTTELPTAQDRATVEVNLFGTWHATAAAMPWLTQAADAHVVNVASGLAVATVPYAAAYTASKRAVLGYSDVLRAETAGTGVAVSAVLPGYIKTAIHDGPAANGVSLEGVVRDEPVRGAVAAVVAALETGRREIASSPRLAAELWASRRLPRIAERVLARRAAKAGVAWRATQVEDPRSISV